MLKAAEKGMRAGKVPPIKEMLEDYYAFRGWNENGHPSEETLEKLGIDV
jgi:aldehyde:ferredoxin oxidoreductase